MRVVGDLLSRDLSKGIEEIIQVDQLDEQTVYSEITDYVATDLIRDHYRRILSAIAEAPSEPHEGVGIWISGFFGSGKSFFAKNLGYVLSNPTVMGERYSELFKRQLGDERISELVDYINKRLPTEVIMFDISKASNLTSAEKIAEVIYRKLLEHLDYAEDYNIAELEIQLESEGRLDEFVRLCEEVNGKEWRLARKGAMKLNEASAILNRMDPDKFPHADSWVRSVQGKKPTITVELVVERAFELMSRRRPGRALFIIIDEVGQYVARNVDRIEDLRAVVEEFGKKSKNLVRAKNAIAPVWIAVTSQEKLEEVVSELDSKRIELAKLQDRFRYRVDLSPADIKEVASRKVLAKKEDAVPVLRDLFERYQGQINLGCRLERTTRRSEVAEDEFIQCYPYLPHFIDISIDIMSGIRMQPGAPMQMGGSNRTIIKQAYEILVSGSNRTMIKQAYEMLDNKRTALKDKPIGALVTLDRVFDIVEGNISSEKRKDIIDIGNMKDDWALRVAKVICLLEFVRDLPRTEGNIAAFLVDEIGAQKPVDKVRAALDLLQKAKFIRSSEDGWKLQTAKEKSWETEKRGYAPKPRDRREIQRLAISAIFDDPALRSYSYESRRTFKLGISYINENLVDGQIQISVVSCDDRSSLQGEIERIRDESWRDEHRNEIFFVFPLSTEIDDLVTEVFQSGEMVKRYDQLRSQNSIAPEDARLLEDEKRILERKRGMLVDKMKASLMEGAFIFRGIQKDASELGRDFRGALKKLLDDHILDLYPRLPQWAWNLKGDEAEKLLKAANLDGLPAIFYSDPGPGLLVRDNLKYVLNTRAEVVMDVMGYLSEWHRYGEQDKLLGKALEDNFCGIGYGGDLDMLRLVLAVLFRAGAIEVSFEGKRFDSYRDNASHLAFTNNRTFRNARFTPAEDLDAKKVARAALRLEELTGESVDVDRNAIASAFKEFASRELRDMQLLEERLRVNRLPGIDSIERLKGDLEGLQKSTASEIVCALSDGDDLKKRLEKARAIKNSVNEKLIDDVREARRALEIWGSVGSRLGDGEIESMAGMLKSILESEDLYSRLSDMKRASSAIYQRYREIYEKLHASRREAFMKLLEEIRRSPEWERAEGECRARIQSDLEQRGCECSEMSDSWVCSRCGASIKEMEMEIMALPGIRSRMLERLAKCVKENGEKHLVRVRASEVCREKIESPDDLERALQALREHLMKLLNERKTIIFE
ncbi:MAG: BREX system P-loop protein BrxC [Methanothrix sp.]